MQLAITIVSTIIVFAGFYLIGAEPAASRVSGGILFLTGAASLLLLRLNWRFDGSREQLIRFFLMVFSLAGLLGGMVWFVLSIANDQDAWKPLTGQNLCCAAFCALCLTGLIAIGIRQNRA